MYLFKAERVENPLLSICIDKYICLPHCPCLFAAFLEVLSNPPKMIIFKARAGFIKLLSVWAEAIILREYALSKAI